MTKHVFVDPSLKDRRVITGAGPQYGDNQHIIDVAPREFRALSAYYPILITKDSGTGRFLPAAVMGFSAGENLFLGEEGWDVTYIPMNIRRQPFSVLPKETTDELGNTVKVPALSIDLDSPRLSLTEGERMFDDHDQATAWFQEMSQLMLSALEGGRAAQTLMTRMQDLDLIEPLKIGFEFSNGEKMNLRGLYSINEPRFRELSDDIVLELHKAGHLEAIYAMMASLSQLGNLVNRKNARLKAAV